MTLPQEGIPVHISMIEYFTRFRDDILQHAKPTCFEELTVFHLLSYMGKTGDKNWIGAMSAEERMAASEKGYKNGLRAMSAEERMAAYENGIGSEQCRLRQGWQQVKRDMRMGSGLCRPRRGWQRVQRVCWRQALRGRRSKLSSKDAWKCQR